MLARRGAIPDWRAPPRVKRKPTRGGARPRPRAPSPRPPTVKPGKAAGIASREPRHPMPVRDGKSQPPR
jgi:hypothetical protein